MSRSYRHIPIVGACADSDQWSKRKANRKLRRLIRQMPADEDALVPLKREHSDVWSFPKDGKFYWHVDGDEEQPWRIWSK